MTTKDQIHESLRNARENGYHLEPKIDVDAITVDLISCVDGLEHLTLDDVRPHVRPHVRSFFSTTGQL